MPKKPTKKPTPAKTLPTPKQKQIIGRTLENEDIAKIVSTLLGETDITSQDILKETSDTVNKLNLVDKKAVVQLYNLRIKPKDFKVNVESVNASSFASDVKKYPTQARMFEILQNIANVNQLKRTTKPIIGLDAIFKQFKTIIDQKQKEGQIQAQQTEILKYLEKNSDKFKKISKNLQSDNEDIKNVGIKNVKNIQDLPVNKNNLLIKKSLLAFFNDVSFDKTDQQESIKTINDKIYPLSNNDVKAALLDFIKKDGQDIEDSKQFLNSIDNPHGFVLPENLPPPSKQKTQKPLNASDIIKQKPIEQVKQTGSLFPKIKEYALKFSDEHRWLTVLIPGLQGAVQAFKGIDDFKNFVLQKGLLKLVEVKIETPKVTSLNKDQKKLVLKLVRDIDHKVFRRFQKENTNAEKRLTEFEENSDKKKIASFNKQYFNKNSSEYIYTSKYLDYVEKFRRQSKPEQVSENDRKAEVLQKILIPKEIVDNLKDKKLFTDEVQTLIKTIMQDFAKHNPSPKV